MAGDIILHEWEPAHYKRLPITQLIGCVQPASLSCGFVVLGIFGFILLHSASRTHTNFLGLATKSI
jgi:hypothetical protein